MESKTRNQGEENEVFLKAFLIKTYSEGGLFGADIISSLSFGPNVPVPKWESKCNQFLKNRDYKNLKSIFPKAAGNFKADVEINKIKYSLKYSGAAKPAIINHTNRSGFLRIFKQLNIEINELDLAINSYWIKRESGIIKEDIDNSDPESPFKNLKKYLKPILEYFLFTGTGSKDSLFFADMLLEFSNPTNPETFNILSKSDAVDKIWDKLRFSIRGKKGMPTQKVSGVLTNTYSQEKYPDLALWVRYHPKNAEFPKGALHIRY